MHPPPHLKLFMYPTFETFLNYGNKSNKKVSNIMNTLWFYF